MLKIFWFDFLKILSPQATLNPSPKDCRRLSCLLPSANLKILLRKSERNGVSLPLIRRIVVHETAYRLDSNNAPLLPNNLPLLRNNPAILKKSLNVWWFGEFSRNLQNNQHTK